MAVTGNQILFEVDLGKVKRQIEDWGFLTSDSTRDKGIDAFYALLGSATLNLQSTPERLKRVIQKINDYLDGVTRWRQEGKTIGKIEERMLRGISEIETLLKIPESEQKIEAPMDPAKDGHISKAVNEVMARQDELEAELAAERAARAEAEKDAEEPEGEKEGRPWWVIPVGGAAAAYLAPKILKNVF